MSNTVPEVKEVTNEEHQTINKYYKGYSRRWVRLGPAGYLMPARFGDHVGDFRNLEVRSDDVWVLSFSRSGTTWLQELAWLVANNLDFQAAESVSLVERYAFIEYPTQLADGKESKGYATKEDFRTIGSLQSPRYIKTHLPLSLLPPTLLDTAKVLYIARDPRDVAVSFFFMHKLFRYFDDSVTFPEFWELFKKNLLCHMPIIPHVVEAWQQRTHPNMLFLFYEDMQKDLGGVIDRVSTFLGCQYTAEKKEQLAAYLSFESMSRRTNYGVDNKKDTEVKFMRKGKSGGWVNYFEGALRQEAEEYMQKHLENTNLRYPDYKS